MFATKEPRVRLEGTIAGAGFESGDRIVIGAWRSSPLGPMTDVMWARPDGCRVLLAPTSAVAAFVRGVYSFDEVMVVPIDLLASSSDRVHVVAGPLELELRGGAPSRLFGLRPRWLRRSATWVRVEDLALRALVGRLLLRGAPGVRAYGISPSGVREWYCIDDYRPIVSGRASLDGSDLGPLAPLAPRAGFGFSEFPLRPALVHCAPLLGGAERFLPPSSPDQPSGSGRTGRR